MIRRWTGVGPPGRGWGCPTSSRPTAGFEGLREAWQKRVTPIPLEEGH